MVDVGTDDSEFILARISEPVSEISMFHEPQHLIDLLERDRNAPGNSPGDDAGKEEAEKQGCLQDRTRRCTGLFSSLLRVTSQFHDGVE